MGSKSKQQQQHKREFVQFKQWVRSLNRKDLLDCMAFPFHGQAEYDLLLDMVSMDCKVQSESRFRVSHKL